MAGGWGIRGHVPRPATNGVTEGEATPRGNRASAELGSIAVRLLAAMHPRWTTQRRLLVFSLVTLLPLTFAVALLVQQNVNMAASAVSAEAAAAAATARANADNFLNKTEMQLTTLAQHPAIGTRDPYGSTRVLRDVMPLIPNYDNIFVTDEKGLVFASAKPLPPSAVNVSDRQYFRQALATGNLALSDQHVGRMNGELTIALAVPFGSNGGRAVGVVVGVVTLHELRPVLDAERADKGFAVSVVDSAGTILAGYSPFGSIDEDTYGVVSLAQLGLPDAPGSMEYVAAGGERWLVTSVPGGRADWQFVVAYPSRLISDGVQRGLRRDLGYAGLALTAAVLLAVLVGRSVAKPLHDLARRGAALALEAPPRSLLGDDVRELGNVLDIVSRRLVSGPEEERQRIVRDIHDGIAQLVAVSQVYVQECYRCATNGGAVCRQCGGNGESNPRKLSTLLDLLAQAMAEIDQVMFNLRPAELTRGDLVAALKTFLRRFEANYNIGCSLDVTGAPHALSPEVATQVFRIAQEALQNIRKHACSSRAQLLLAFGSRDLWLSVADNGRGLADGMADSTMHAHRGFSNMRERARSFGGDLIVSSTAGRGTIIEVHVPIIESPVLARSAQAVN